MNGGLNMNGENMKTFRQDNFIEPVIPDDLQDVLKWTEIDQRIVDTMEAIITQYATQVDTAILDECYKATMKFNIAVDEERLVQALTDAQKFYCEGYRAGKAAAIDEIVRCKDCKFRCETDDGEYNPEDIVCTYWATDGLKACDFCSKSERRDDDGTQV